MIPPRPIVLHLSRDDYSGTLCGLGREAMRDAVPDLAAAETAHNLFYPRCGICNECRRQAAKEEGTNE